MNKKYAANAVQLVGVSLLLVVTGCALERRAPATEAAPTKPAVSKPTPPPTEEITKKTPSESALKPAQPEPAAATTPPEKPTTATVTEKPPAKPPAKPAAEPGPAPLDLAELERRLKETKAIGIFTKLTLKNQVDDLLEKFRAYYQGQLKTTLDELRQPFNTLMLKVLALLQDGDPQLARDLVASREALWGILADPKKFAAI